MREPPLIALEKTLVIKSTDLLSILFAGFMEPTLNILIWKKQIKQFLSMEEIDGTRSMEAVIHRWMNAGTTCIINSCLWF